MPDRNNRRASAAGAVKDRGPLRGVLRTSLTALLAPANLHLWGAEAPPLKRVPLYTLILPFFCPEDGEHLRKPFRCHAMTVSPAAQNL